MKINVIDLFAGCGGLSEGFKQQGNFNTLAAVDWELPAVSTLRKRLQDKWGYKDADRRVIHFDLQRSQELLQGYEDDKYASSPGLKKIVGAENVDLIIGGPPCQAYSIAGRVRDKNGMKDDYRNYLFESYVEVVKVFKPKYFVFENVEGMLSAKPGGILITERIKQAFNDAGYDITSSLRSNALFDTSFYNVPQRRKRVIIFGVRSSGTSHKEINFFYEKLKELGTEFPKKANEAFVGLPELFPNDKESKPSHVCKEHHTVSNHEPRYHSKRDIEIFKILAEDIEKGSNKYTNTQALIKLYKEKTGKSSKFHKYHVIRRDLPSNTIPAHLYKDGLRHIHPDPKQARSITVREAARIQSFPDDFVFLGSRGDQYKMIGNAVPPEFAKTIANVINSLFSD